jgi:cell division transport system permease protein
MLTPLKRAIKLGYKNFFRSIGISIATVFIVSASVFLISILFIFNSAADILIDNIKKKVDISVYFVETAKTEEILAIKAELLKIPEVKSIDYVTKEQALEEFTKKHSDEQILIDSLSEIGKNPFLASLNVSVLESSKYQQIVDFLNGDNYKNLVERVDYFQRKSVIDRLYAISENINKGGMILSIILGIISILVAFNAIKVAIYSSKDEISVMRLVGASNWFIRGPFLIQGLIAGLIVFVISFFAIFWLCYGFNGSIKEIAPEISPFKIFIANFWILVIIQVVSGISIAMISSVFAIRKYLKV